MWVSALCVMLAASMAMPCAAPQGNQAPAIGAIPWRARSKREEVLVPDWILAEGCHVENCAELTGREAPDSFRNASRVKMRTPQLVTEPSPRLIRFPGGKEVPVSSTDLRSHLANALCCLVNEVTHVADRAARAKLMTSFYENVISWLEELLIPAMATEQYVSVEEHESVSRLAKDLGVLQQGRYVPSFFLDVTEAREREEERLHLQTIGVIVVCAVGSVLLAFGLLFCVAMARGKKRAVARSQGEMEPLLDAASPPTPDAATDQRGTDTTPDESLGQLVVSRALLGSSARDSSTEPSPRNSIREITVTSEGTSDRARSRSTGSASVSPRRTSRSHSLPRR